MASIRGLAEGKNTLTFFFQRELERFGGHLDVRVTTRGNTDADAGSRGVRVPLGTNAEEDALRFYRLQFNGSI